MSASFSHVKTVFLIPGEVMRLRLSCRILLRNSFECKYQSFTSAFFFHLVWCLFLLIVTEKGKVVPPGAVWESKRNVWQQKPEHMLCNLHWPPPSHVCMPRQQRVVIASYRPRRQKCTQISIFPAHGMCLIEFLDLFIVVGTSSCLTLCCENLLST